MVKKKGDVVDVDGKDIVVPTQSHVPKGEIENGLCVRVVPVHGRGHRHIHDKAIRKPLVLNLSSVSRLRGGSSQRTVGQNLSRYGGMSRVNQPSSQQVEKRRLAGTRRANDGQDFTRGCTPSDVGQNGLDFLGLWVGHVWDRVVC